MATCENYMFRKRCFQITLKNIWWAQTDPEVTSMVVRKVTNNAHSRVTEESISQKENAYQREHAVAQKNLKMNIRVQRLSTDSPRTLRLPRASLHTGPQNPVFLIFETSILLSKSQGWVTITTINLRVLEK